MHMHVILQDMRTTIEITAEQRSKLMALAARQNEKGFSRLVREAIDNYLEHQLEASEKIERAVRLRGSLGEEDIAALTEERNRLRESWR